MTNRAILILGGYGNTGLAIARLLLQHTDVCLVLAGRNLAKAQGAAIPVAACLLQYLDGSIRKPGLWTQANIVEPKRLMKDMQRMGVAVQIQERR